MPDDNGRAGSPVELLSTDERRLLACMVAGQSPKAIADSLGITDVHTLALRDSVMAKLGARCTADAVREGIIAGL